MLSGSWRYTAVSFCWLGRFAPSVFSCGCLSGQGFRLFFARLYFWGFSMPSVSSLPFASSSAALAGSFSGVRVRAARSGPVAVFVFRSRAAAVRFAASLRGAVGGPFLPMVASSGSRRSWGVPVSVSGASAPAYSVWFPFFSGGRAGAVGALAARAFAAAPATPPAPVAVLPRVSGVSPLWAAFLGARA